MKLGAGDGDGGEERWEELSFGEEVRRFGVDAELLVVVTGQVALAYLFLSSLSAGFCLYEEEGQTKTSSMVTLHSKRGMNRLSKHCQPIV